jgi:phosphoglycerol transferase MdoB-like AlkP superfamily enzyme
MANQIKFILYQAISFFGLLIIGKVLFLSYHSGGYLQLSADDQLGIFRYGFALDISITAYLIVIPVFILFLRSLLKSQSVLLLKINRLYHLIICIVISCVFIIDIELFRTWHIRVDASPFKYLANPTEMLASVGASPFKVLVPIFVFLLLISIFLNRFVFKRKYEFSAINPIFEAGVILLFLASLIIPIRGGLQLAPINQSSAYFSQNNFANQAAVNPVYNLLHSLTHKTTGKNPFLSMPQLEADSLINHLYLNDTESDIKIINGKPNVLLITWESLTAKVLHQKMEVTPNLKKILKEGVYFNNCYASGDRSDKGMVAILSGYPAQPIASIINLPQKTLKLPIISKALNEKGYTTSWYYGGEPEFANIKSYILNGQFEKLVSKVDFPEKYTKDTKWGANDAIVFDRLAADLSKMKQPFFINYFTLSSHEPFEIPDHDIIKGEDETSKFLNAHHFTDEQLGLFLTKAKTQEWYKNTLIIITADHGHRLPVTDSKKDEFHIPLVFFGGALSCKPMIINDIVSQNDIAESILGQLNFENSDYKWSKNIFSTKINPSAYFCFNNGFGLVQANNWYAFDNNTKLIIGGKGKISETDLQLGKAIQQATYADYLAK